MKKFFLILLTVAVLAAVAGLVGLAGAQQDPGTLISLADQEYSTRYSLQASSWQEYLQGYRPHLEEALSLYETAASDPVFSVLSVQSQAHVYNRLSQLYYEKTVYYPDDEEEYFAQGKDWGLRSLRLNPSFKKWEDKDFSKAVNLVTDPAALLWTADNWGSWLDYHPFRALGGEVKKVMVLYQGLMKIDASYWGGSVYNALGAMLVTVPSFLGGNREQGLEYLKQATELFPDYLENHVVYADYAGFNRDMMGHRTTPQDIDLVRRELTFVIQAQVHYDFPFWNWEGKREAEMLWEEAGL